METMNYYNMNQKEKDNYDAFANEIYQLKRVSIWDGEKPYIEIKTAKPSLRKIEKIKEIIQKYGYVVKEMYACEGSDYPSFCIWFGK